MKRLFTIIALALLPLSAFAEVTAQDSISFAAAKWTTIHYAKGATLQTAQVQMFGDTEYISVYSYPAKRLRTSIVRIPQGGATTSQIGTNHKAKAAINASYFTMKTCVSDVYTRIDGKMEEYGVKDEDFRCNGMIVADKGRLEIKTLDRNYKCNNALGSGPILILDGETWTYDPTIYEGGERTFYTRQHPRTVIGYDSDKDRIYFIVIDGRFPGQSKGTTIEETTAIARWLGLEDALNLDGGGSSTLWTQSQGVVNHPYDNRKFDHQGERKIPTAIICK